MSHEYEAFLGQGYEPTNLPKLTGDAAKMRFKAFKLSASVSTYVLHERARIALSVAISLWRSKAKRNDSQSGCILSSRLIMQHKWLPPSRQCSDAMGSAMYG